MAVSLQELTIGIIGGRGRMGRFFADQLRPECASLIISDRENAPAHSELVQSADIIIVAVPISQAVSAIRSIAPNLRSSQLIIDVTSLKKAPVDAMLASSAEVLGLHPMFAPEVATMVDQTVIAVPARTAEKVPLFLELLRRRGAKLTETTAESHDRMMAVIQGLTHFSAIATAAALKELGVEIGETAPFASPVYRLRMGMVGRIMAQDASLYADIALCNPETKPVLEALEKVSRELFASIASGDRDRFIKIFTEASDHLGDYRAKAMEESSRLIKQLK